MMKEMKSNTVPTRSPSKRSDPKLMTEVFDLPFTQADVDFVIPDLAGDLRIGIDPFLLFKSKSPDYKTAHDLLLRVFNEALAQYARGNRDRAAYLLDFPEVDEIGFGYKQGSGPGSGLGPFLNRLLLQTLGESPLLLKRGVRHVEEMQLVAVGINADRISDIAANLLKDFLIDYTQRQAETYGIPVTKGVPLMHVFDHGEGEWRDDYHDLPVNPLDPKKRAILLVPRRIVRSLPWINFDDYQRTEFGMFLRAKRATKASGDLNTPQKKADIVAVTRREVERIDHYIDAKERDARRASPDNLITATPQLKAECEKLLAELKSMGTGQGDAYLYQDLMFRVLNILFTPDLIEGRKEVRTEHGTERRDLLYTNDSDLPFWEYVRNQHQSLTMVFECKNTLKVGTDDVDQVASYLGDALGYFGVILTRGPLSDERRRKCLAWYNKGFPRRVIIALSDEHIERMLQMRANGKNPTDILRYQYQEFMAKAQ